MKNPLLNLSRQQLAQLGREYMIAAQINSRVGYARIRMDHGDDAYLQVAIPNWMAASPVYTQRMQRAMGFAGENNVRGIFKGLQLECGFSHQYFDVSFELDTPDSGRFWLDSCGPLLEAEPRGEQAVRTMCHDIEDPTFDATAIATNPRARMRPLHRPPRQPDSEGPVCSWHVFIDENAQALTTPEITRTVEQSVLAQVTLESLDANDEPGGMDDYSGELLKKLSLEVFSRKALVTIDQELALQNNLLIRSLLMVVAREFGEAAASTVGQFQMVGSARLVSERLCRVPGLYGGGVQGLSQILAVHPTFQPLTYSQLQTEILDDTRIAVQIGDGPALKEKDPYSWIKLLCSGADEGLESLARGIDPSARCWRDEQAAHRWIISIGNATDNDSADSLPVQVGRGAIATGFQFTDAEDTIRIIE